MQAPAFQFYASDYLSSSKVQRMSLEAQGAYVRLLCYSWQDGWIPADISQLARLCGVAVKKMASLWDSYLRECFEPLAEDPDKLVNRRLEDVRQKLAKHKTERSESGSKGAEKRWQKDGSAIEQPLAKNGSPSPSPSPVIKQENPPIVPLPPQKGPYGVFGNVMLTVDEYDKLHSRYGSFEVYDHINALSEYIESKGKKYKSHYATILTWERKNGAQNHGNNKQDRNAEAARRLLSRLNSQDSGGILRGDPGVESSRLSRTLAAIDGRADENRDGSHD